jgi:hypothetical protein
MGHVSILISLNSVICVSKLEKCGRHDNST